MNDNCLAGFRCPSCGEEDALYIGYTMDAVILTWDSGTDDIHGDLEYDGWSVATCPSCHWSGTVNDLYLAHDAEHGTSNGTRPVGPREAVEVLTAHADAAAGRHEDAAAAAYAVLREAWGDGDRPDVAGMVADIDRVIAALSRYRNLVH